MTFLLSVSFPGGLLRTSSPRVCALARAARGGPSRGGSSPVLAAVCRVALSALLRQPARSSRGHVPGPDGRACRWRAACACARAPGRRPLSPAPCRTRASSGIFVKASKPQSSVPSGGAFSSGPGRSDVLLLLFRWPVCLHVPLLLWPSRVFRQLVFLRPLKGSTATRGLSFCTRVRTGPLSF